jgi:hypothetical protein
MNVKTVEKIRQDNLQELVRIYGQQTLLAIAISDPSLKQPTISSIIRGKRTYHAYEARITEVKLDIPYGWMDLEEAIKNDRTHILAFRNIPDESKAICNRLLRLRSRKS